MGDFLPFTCDLCSAVLCKDHLRYEDHDCPHQAKKDVRVELCQLCETAVRVNPDEDFQVTLEKHMATAACADAVLAREAKRNKPRCPVEGCKAKLTQSGSVRCGTCNQRVCLKHRFEDAHPCKVVESARPCNGGCGRQALESAVTGLLGRIRIPI